MTPEEIKKALEYNTGAFPFEAMRGAIAQREAMTPILLAEIERAADNPQAIFDEDESYILPFFAIYLLAQFRETRAFEPMIRLCQLSRETLDDLIGDVVTSGLGNILASTFSDDTTPIEAVIENKNLDEFVRDAGLSALITLVAEGVIAREEFIEYLRKFSRTLTPEDSLMGGLWVNAAADIYPEELMPEIRAAFEAGLVDEMLIDLEDVKNILADGRDATLADLNRHHHYITDTIGELSRWASFQNIPDRKQEEFERWEGEKYSWSSSEIPVETYRRETPKIGRNDPCPCGSGKKYKKCCLSLLS
ncbi:MAG TPA: DUF1186 domain-containing protein [Burkholderiales bacterium]|jgi:hypothetical protein|nr:DUF1186 domain-containing protein [Burkholderiales bacterium]